MRRRAPLAFAAICMQIAACKEAKVDTDSGLLQPTPRCPTFDGPAQVGAVAGNSPTEASGLAWLGDTLWTHDDSGGSATLFGLSASGDARAQLDLALPRPTDWEDLAAVTLDGVPWLVVADIGDNSATRTDVSLVWVEAPSELGTHSAWPAHRQALRYPIGPTDAETLLLDAATRQVLVLTKSLAGETHVLVGPLDPSLTEVTLSDAGTLQFGEAPLASDKLLTGGDASDWGVALRTYLAVWYFPRHADQSVLDALFSEPCPVPAPGEAQGEAIALSNTGLWTLSEGVHAPIWHIPQYEAP